MQKNQNDLAKIIKSVADKIVSSILLILFLPIMLLIAIVVKLRMGSPVLFIQPRPGKHSHIFNFYKFRSMNSKCDSQGNLLPDEQRLTTLGQFLRKTSLDELPQLWNVIKGDMSLVGPRPLLVEYLERYDPEQARRHDVLPGITGWAQVNGRNSLDWDEKFKLDVWYVDNWSLWLDFKILTITFVKVLQRDGISQANHATMSKFKDNS